MTHKYKWLFKPTIRNFVILTIGIFINVLGGSLTLFLGAPIWLDSIGTILCACLVGPLGGCIAGIAGTIICHINTPLLWTYSLGSIWISLCTAILYQKTKLHDAFQIVCTSLIIMILCTITAVPLNLLLQSGYIGNIWGNALVDMLRQGGNGPLFCCILGQLFIELPDKILCCFVADFLTKKGKYIIEKHERRAQK